jgi:ribosomal protein S18 acetylase RimI-like enzyme
MTPGLKVRAAEPADADFAASMIYLSLGHLADHLFVMQPDEIEKMIAKLFTRNAGRFGYGSTFIAEFENEPVGALVTLRGDAVKRSNFATIPHLIAVLGFAHAISFIWRAVRLPGGKEAEDDEFFIDFLGVHPSMQGRSFGSQLLAYAEQLARENDLTKCSLVVGWYNTSARRLYERTGYRVMETVQDNNETLGYYRMVKVL